MAPRSLVPRAFRLLLLQFIVLGGPLLPRPVVGLTTKQTAELLRLRGGSSSGSFRSGRSDPPEEEPIVQVPEIHPPVEVNPTVGDFENEVEEPTCSCDCCTVVKRLPADVVNGQELKCGQDPHKASCSGLCDPKQRGKQVLEAGETHGTSTETYCLLECKMTDDALGSPCVRLSYEEREAQTTEGGNGQDAGLPPAATEVSIPEAVAAPPPPPKKEGLSAEELRDAARIKDVQDAAKDALDAAAAATR